MEQTKIEALLRALLEEIDHNGGCFQSMYADMMIKEAFADFGEAAPAALQRVLKEVK